MKRILVGLFMMLLFGSVVWAQTWHTANQTSVSWSAVTHSTTGDPLTDDITYKLYLANAVTDPDKSTPSLIVEGVVDTRYTITLGVEGRFFVGIKAVRSIDGEVVAEGEMSWSDDPLVVANGQTFGIRYFLPPAEVVGLGIE